MPTCPNCNHTWGQQRKKREYKIQFNYETAKFEGFTKEIDIWKEKFPAIDVLSEIKKAEAWCFDNPANKKSDWQRFLGKWLRKAQDNAPRRDNGQNAIGGGRTGGPRTFTKQREIEQQEQAQRLLKRAGSILSNRSSPGNQRPAIDGERGTVLDGEADKISEMETEPIS